MLTPESYLVRELLQGTGGIAPIWDDEGTNRQVGLYPASLPASLEQLNNIDIVYVRAGPGNQIRTFDGVQVMDWRFTLAFHALDNPMLARFDDAFAVRLWSQTRAKMLSGPDTGFNAQAQRWVSDWNITIDAIG